MTTLKATLKRPLEMARDAFYNLFTAGLFYVLAELFVNWRTLFGTGGFREAVENGFLHPHPIAIATAAVMALLLFGSDLGDHLWNRRAKADQPEESGQ